MEQMHDITDVEVSNTIKTFAVIDSRMPGGPATDVMDSDLPNEGYVYPMDAEKIINNVTDVEENTSRNRQVVLTGGKSHMKAMLALAAAAMAGANSSAQGFAAASPFQHNGIGHIPLHGDLPDFPGYNSGYKIPKKYSPGQGGNKTITFDKKKKAAKAAAASKRKNRK